MLKLLNFFKKPIKPIEQLVSTPQVYAPYNPFKISSNFPNGFIFGNSNKLRYHLEKSGKLVCYRFGLDADEESDEEKWIPTEREFLQNGTNVEGFGILPDENLASIVNSYIAESRTENTDRILRHRKEVRDILRISAANPSENPSQPLVVLYDEHSAKTTANGTIGLYFSSWYQFKPTL